MLKSAVKLVAVGAGLASAALAQKTDLNKVAFSVQPVARNIYMISGGAGGNIGMCVGDDGVVLIDDMFAPLSEKITAAVKSITSLSIRHLINTHHHGDLTGANAKMAGIGVTLVAHDNTYIWLSSEQISVMFGRTSPPQPKGMHMWGYTIEATKIGPAHTDTGVAFRFVGADVYHLGDAFFNDTYPFIDLGAGGTIDKMISVMANSSRRRLTALQSFAATASCRTRVVCNPIAT